MSIVKFPFKYISTNSFGKVFRPYAKILVRKKDIPNVWLERIAIVDTGADFTIFPKKDAAIFGIDLERETKPDKTFGIGGQEKIYLYEKLEIRLGDAELIIPVGFLDRNDIPALLGRQKFLEIIKLILENRTTIIEK